MDKLTAIKIKYDDGTYSDEIPVGVLSKNVEWDSTHTLVDVLGSIDVDVTGAIQAQIDKLSNNNTQFDTHLASIDNDLKNFMNVLGDVDVNAKGSLQNQIDNLDTQLSDDANQLANLSNQLANIGKTVYPVGSIYISVIDTSPASLFGGAWEQLKDKFLLAAGDSYVAGSTGGEATHTLSASEMPSHSHSYSNATGVQRHQLTVNEMPSHTHGIHWVGATSPQGGGNNSDFGVAQVAIGNQQSGATGGNGSHNHELSKANANTTNTGAGAAHNNMPPYLAVYAWKRVA